MAYNALNNLIDAYIYANGVQAITGQILNGVLKQMVSQLGSGYHLMGVAVPATDPEQNDFAMAYFAATAGEYTDFGGITLAAGEVAVLLTSGNGSWSKQTIYNVPTGTADLENTANFITNAVTDLVNYYTKTEVDTTLADYPTLEALATALADYYTKTEVDGQMGDVNAALADRYTKTETDTKLEDYYRKAETYDRDEINSIVSALNHQSYDVAWDGTTAPDVSTIPAGVTVTYSGTTYTGTLAASADTVNKIYMVWNGTAYDMYGTSQDGGYSWVPMGTTSVDLSQYATKAEMTDLYGGYVESPEYIRAYTDKDGRLLFAIKTDGTAYAAAGFESDGAVSLEGEQINIIDNPEFVYVRTDKDGKILYGVQKDGNIIFGCGVPSQILDYINNRISELSLDEYENIVAFLGDLVDGDQTLAQLIDGKVDKIAGKGLSTNDFTNAEKAAVDMNSLVESPEYLRVETDADGKVLGGRRTDWTLEEKIGISTPSVEVDGNEVSVVETPEDKIVAVVDETGRVIAYRKADGTIVENVGVETPSLKLTGDGLSELAADLRAAGVANVTNWSDKSELHIPEPYCAFVNFTGIDGMPQTKTTDAHAVIQFWDMNGNYFKKEVIANAQGRSTMAHPKKNIAIDICNNNGWDDDDTFSLQIGDWVPQDSFHLKAYYNDPFRGMCAVGYELYDEMVKTRGALKDYVWKRALFDLGDITPTSTGEDSGADAEGQFFTGARCFPGGFPVIVYLNGQFYGIFSWQLKKHRDNYHMKKNKAKQIHLDGVISADTLLNANGDASQIVWTTDNPEGFEVRNPKTLYKMDGTKYDADNNGGELIDATSAYYNPSNADHVITAEVKQHIVALSQVMPAIASAAATYEASQKTAADLAAFKAVFETYFDVDNLIDYLIFSDVVRNYDGWGPNWQWITYNGTRWYIMPYDVDGIMGNWFALDDTILAPLNAHFSYYWTPYIISYYGSELNARYAELRDKGIIDATHIQALCVSWMDRIGNKDMFEKEWEKWPSFVKNDSPLRLAKWIETSIQNMDTVYSYNQ